MSCYGCYSSFNRYYFSLHLDLKAFLLHVTSKTTVSKQSVQVDFLEDSTAIAAHTCSNLLVFPRNAYVDTEGSFANFCAAMKAVIFSPMSFNMV